MGDFGDCLREPRAALIAAVIFSLACVVVIYVLGVMEMLGMLRMLP